MSTEAPKNFDIFLYFKFVVGREEWEMWEGNKIHKNYGLFWS